MGDLLLLYDLALGQDLHGVYALGVPFPDLEDPAERPAADKLQELEVSGRQCALGLHDVRPRARNEKHSRQPRVKGAEM